ncbi:rRNA maturation RNase YbeY [bacterium]|nr:rRNA maturation RNase YbeY [bacterium]
MTEINVFIQNEYEAYAIDEVKLYNDTLKIADFIFSDDALMQKSCLKGSNNYKIFFDIVLMNNEEIHRINKEYRQKDSPTDVITFAIFADSKPEERFVFENEVHLGEIMISLDRIEEQAKENNVTFEDEIYFIISHGILHLLGFDHLTQEDYNFMVENQNRAKAVLK